ncbi:reverse transcriptase domain-containing protein [Tanacetum coccineum]
MTTVSKPATKAKTLKDADATPRVNIHDFYEDHYEDILLVIMDKIRCDKRKEVHASLDFRESPKKRRIREGSQNSSARTLSARYRNPSERLKVRDRLRYNDRHVLDRLGHRRQSAFDRLSDTYSPSTTKSGPDKANSRDRSHSRSLPHRRDSSNKDHPRSRDRSRDIEESYDNICSSYGMRTKYGYRSYNRDRSRAARVWFDELPPESIDGYKDLKAAFLAYFMQQKKYVKDPIEIHNIKQRDGENIKDFMERSKVETRRMKGAIECMRISGFMHGVNNPELTKCLNEHVPKTMEEMMIAITTFI